MNIKKHVLAAATALALGAGGVANAAVLVEGWTLDLGAALGGGYAGFTVAPINEITFTGLARGTNQDTNGDGTFGGTGDVSFTDGLLTSTGFVGGGGAFGFATDGIGGVKVINLDFEITFDFSVDTLGKASGVGGAQQFDHLAYNHGVGGGPYTDGLLDVYIDDLTDGAGAKSDPDIGSPGAGLGFADGVKVATFRVLGIDGGVFDFTTFDGSDDATFELVSALPGVLLDENGNDLSLGELLAISDSNFDADPDNNNAIDSTIANVLTGCNGLTVVCAKEDGSFVLANVPEPASLAVLGVGLLGMFGLRRRKRA